MADFVLKMKVVRRMVVSGVANRVLVVKDVVEIMLEARKPMHWMISRPNTKRWALPG